MNVDNITTGGRVSTGLCIKFSDNGGFHQIMTEKKYSRKCEKIYICFGAFLLFQSSNFL